MNNLQTFEAEGIRAEIHPVSDLIHFRRMLLVRLVSTELGLTDADFDYAAADHPGPRSLLKVDTVNVCWGVLRFSTTFCRINLIVDGKRIWNANEKRTADVLMAAFEFFIDHSAWFTKLDRWIEELDRSDGFAAIPGSNVPPAVAG